MRKVIWVAALCALLAPLCAGDDRNFAGDWELNRDRSDINALQPAPAERMKVEQEGTTIRCTPLLHAALVYTTDGKPAKSTAGDSTFDVRTKWEGSAMLVNALVNEPHNNYVMMERWKLSHDLNTLTIRRQIVGRDGRQTESELVYERAGARRELAVRTAAGAASDGAKTAAAPDVIVARGTRIPLRLVSTVSTRTAVAGDRVYLETVYPIVVNGRVVIPPGSPVTGTVTESKRGGRIRGRAELFLRFDDLMLPNGVMRSFRSRMGSTDAESGTEFDRSEGKVRAAGDKSGDAQKVARAAGAGAGVGAVAGGAAGHLGMGAGIGAAAAGTAGLAAVMASRGADATLAKGSVLEMVLDRDVRFTAADLGR